MPRLPTHLTSSNTGFASSGIGKTLGKFLATKPGERSGSNSKPSRTRDAGSYKPGGRTLWTSLAGKETHQSELTDFFERQVADYFDDELGGKLDHQDRSPVRARASGRQRSRIAFFAQVGVGALRPRVRPHRGLLVLPDLSPNAIFYERPGCCSSCHLDGSILGFKGCVGISLVRTDFVRSMKSETLEMRRN